MLKKLRTRVALIHAAIDLRTLSYLRRAISADRAERDLEGREKLIAEVKSLLHEGLVDTVQDQLTVALDTVRVELAEAAENIRGAKVIEHRVRRLLAQATGEITLEAPSENSDEDTRQLRMFEEGEVAVEVDRPQPPHRPPWHPGG